MPDTLSFGAALAKVLASTVPGPTESVPFREASERVLAESLIADRDEPPASKSAMDGFALRSADTRGAGPVHPATFRYRHTLAAGDIPLEALPEAGQAAPWLGSGEFPAIRVMTGALVPLGADAVVKQENTESISHDAFNVHQISIAGDHIIPKGARMQRGEVLLQAGHQLGPQGLGILATAHRPTVQVFRRPQVALLALGNELVTPDDLLGPASVPVTNLYVVEALARREGADCRNLGIAQDNPAQIAELLEPQMGSARASALRSTPCDFVLTLGGTHRGAFDFVHAVLERLGADLHFDRIAMTPAGSTIFARRGSTLFFGLPGTPAGAWSAFETLVRPALRKRAGRASLNPLRVPARLSTPLEATDDRTAFVPCRVEPASAGLIAFPIQGRHPHESPATQRADALLRRDPHSPFAPEGTAVFIDWVAD
jgi:molybdopterin molybdotransferase